MATQAAPQDCMAPTDASCAAVAEAGLEASKKRMVEEEADGNCVKKVKAEETREERRSEETEVSAVSAKLQENPETKVTAEENGKDQEVKAEETQESAGIQEAKVTAEENGKAAEVENESKSTPNDDEADEADEAEPEGGVSIAEDATEQADNKESNEVTNGTLTKSQLKKQRKRERLKLRKQELKSRDKEKKKERQKKKAEQFSLLSAAEKEAAIERSKKARQERVEEASRKKENLQRSLTAEENVIIDLEFCGVLTEQEISSMAHQVMHLYAANAKSCSPVCLTLTGLDGSIKQSLEKMPGYEKWVLHRESRAYLEVFSSRKDDLVYLTPDSETVMTTFEKSKVYIIGGIVDHNRLKKATLEKATKQGIATARLPIQEHVKLSTSTVLTVNQTVEILLEFIKSQDWLAALKSVIPQRKMA